MATHHCRAPPLSHLNCSADPVLGRPPNWSSVARHATKTVRNGTDEMAITLWDHLRGRAVAAIERGGDRDTSARELLAASGGDRRAVLATHIRLATETADAPDDLQIRRVLGLLQRAIVLGDTENLWHPVYCKSAGR
jgi:hypothetical protein